MLKNKYSNKNVLIYWGGESYLFDSKAESMRAIYLFDRLDKGLIEELILQPKFLLQKKFKRNGINFRTINYIADFSYVESGEFVVEDVKGFLTSVYKLKKKLYLMKYTDDIFREVFLERGVFTIKDY